MSVLRRLIREVRAARAQLSGEPVVIIWDSGSADAVEAAIAQAAGAVDPSCTMPVDQCRELWPHVSFDDVPAAASHNADSRY